MKNILHFLLGILVIIGVSATTVTVMTVKPANPKMVLIKSFTYVSETENFIKDGYKRGYILKGMYNNGTTRDVSVVMEKY